MTNPNAPINENQKNANQQQAPRGYDKLPEHLPEFEPVRAKGKDAQGMGDPSEGDTNSSAKQ